MLIRTGSANNEKCYKGVYVSNTYTTYCAVNIRRNATQVTCKEESENNVGCL
jgi:hypothetical protein